MKRHLPVRVSRYNLLIVVISIVVFQTRSFSQTTDQWTGTTSTNWSVSTNWQSGTPANDLTTNIAEFDSSTAYPFSPNLSAATSIAGLQFGDGSTTTLSLTLSATSPYGLSIGTSGISMMSKAGATTISAPLFLGGNQTWTNNSSNTLTVSGNISNIGNTNPYTLTLAGSGINTLTGIISDGGSTGVTSLILNGTGTTNLSGNSTYSGGTSLISGSLSASASNNALGTGTLTMGTTNNTDANTLVYRANSINPANAIAIYAGGQRILGPGNGNSMSLTGAITLNGGATVSLETFGGGTMSLPGGIGGTGNILFTDQAARAGGVNINTGAVNITGTITNAMPGTETIAVSSNITSTSGVVENSTASVMTLSGTDSYTGATTVTLGTLALGGTGSLGNSGGTSISVASGATFTESSGASITGTSSISSSGTTTLSGINTFTGSTTVNSGTLQVAATGALNNTSSFSVTGGSLLFAKGASANNSAAISLSGTTAHPSTVGLAGTPSSASISLGALTLISGSNSVINFGSGTTTGNTITFNQSTTPIGIISGTVLDIYNWNAAGSAYTSSSTVDSGSNANQDRVVFNGTAQGSDNFGLVQFYSDSGSTLIGLGQEVTFGTGFEIVPVPAPESSTILGGGSLLFLLALKQRRNLFVTGRSLFAFSL